ncbi:MAG: LamG domain-containing protein [Gammaproteobacteria bacterium]|nr:LamG domain-containing protein [Gammaproteobacteria bacterium]
MWHCMCRPWPGLLSRWATIAAVLVVAGCGGASTESNIDTNNTSPAAAYTGPAPATADVRLFQLNLWDNIKSSSRCGGCHDNITGQSPRFAREDDINAAYSAALGVVNLASPADSRLVIRVGGGHNCWLDSASACAAVMTAFIEAWAGGSASGVESRQIELSAPPIKAAGSSKNFPADSGLFATTVHPLLVANCAGCHVDTAVIPQAPFFSNSDPDVAYEAVKSSQKIDLGTPANSRLVVRLRDEFHNCWSASCQVDADEMEAQIVALADQIPLTEVDPQLVASKALNLADGIVASGGSRYESNVIALYEFKTGSGSSIYDTSGVEPALNLQLNGVEGVDYKWVGGWGVEFIDGKAQGNTTPSRKLFDRIQGSGEYSIEAWAVPANVTQEGPAGIVSYSAGTDARNFTLGQTLYNYDFMHRSSTTDGNGAPALSTADADEDLQATQQHVVVTFDPVNGRRIYVNGVFTDDVDSEAAGNLADWDDSYAFVLGNEVTGNRSWAGKLRLVAIHDRALTAAQVNQNFEAGVGEKFFLLFSVSDYVNVADSYILLEVSQFDSYSYLFSEPIFISLDANAVPDNIPLAGMRIGLNGKEVSAGQVYRNLDTIISAAQYDSTTGQLLSRLGTVIAVEKGADADEFFLTFEVLGDNTNVVIEPAPLQPAAPADSAPSADIGLRTFDEINASMSVVTGVPHTTADVQSTYDTIKQQLPSTETIGGFLSAHQVAVSQLAIEYCNALVEDSTLRSNFFGNFNFDADVATAFGSGDSSEKQQIINALVDNMVGDNLASAPSRADIKTELSDPLQGGGLFDKLTTNCPSSCDAVRTRTVVKAMCAAVLGSAVTLLQ